MVFILASASYTGVRALADRGVRIQELAGDATAAEALSREPGLLELLLGLVRGSGGGDAEALAAACAATAVLATLAPPDLPRALCQVRPGVVSS